MRASPRVRCDGCGTMLPVGTDECMRCVMREREPDWSVCHCRVPVRLRMYLGVWACLCGRPVAE